MSSQEIAWAAGIFEGEGSFTTHTKSVPQLHASLSMSDEDIVRRFAKIVKLGNIVGPYTNRSAADSAHRKPYWRWQAFGGEAFTVGNILLPWLGIRRRARFIELVSIRRLWEEGRGPRKCTRWAS